jgi:2-iminobutanoate/2-iminopropanoate deaminase
MTEPPRNFVAAHGITFYPASRAGSPFSRVTCVGDVLYVSGQIGNRPDGTLPDDLVGQARQTMQNIASILASVGCSLDAVFKCTVMLAQMDRWHEFNRAYLEFFDPRRLPARSAFGVNGLVANALVEIECCAHAPVREASGGEGSAA